MIVRNIRKEFNGTLLEIKPDGTFSIVPPDFPTLDCAVAVKAGNIIPDGFNWNICWESTTGIGLAGENELGKWLLEFASARTLSGIDGISVKMSVELQHALPDIEVAVLKIASLKADQFVQLVKACL